MTVGCRVAAGAASGRRKARAAMVTAVAVGLPVALSACSSTGSDTSTHFQRACSDGRAFSGAAAYARTAGVVHPAALMVKMDGSWFEEGSTPQAKYPSGWLISAAEDPKKAQLVACFERTNATPAGKTCQFTDENNKPFTLTMYNTEYRLRVVEARTGRVLSDMTGQAKSSTCPTVTATVEGEDKTKYYTEAKPQDYRSRLSPFIAP